MIAYIGLGSNFGDRKKYIEKAIDAMGSYVKRVSSIYETNPVDGVLGDKFLNAVAEIDTDMSPVDLLEFLEDIENSLGRKEKGNYKPRTIDLDILVYGDKSINTSRLKIPHPRINERDFVKEPLLELISSSKENLDLHELRSQSSLPLQIRVLWEK